MGVWMIGDAKYAGWVVHRCGKQGDPRAEMEFRRLVESGVYRAAPAGTRCGLYAADGDKGLYVITHPEALAEVRLAQAAEIDAKIARATGGQLSPGLASIADRTGATPTVRSGYTRETVLIQQEA